MVMTITTINSSSQLNNTNTKEGTLSPLSSIIQNSNNNNNNSNNNNNNSSILSSELTNMEEQDVIEGAYLMSHLRHHCENCGTFSTPQWRKGWFNALLGRYVLLCNACGLKFHKSQYCPYCYYVYGKEQDRSAGAWVGCTSCSRWTHSECELRYGQPSSTKIDPQSYICVQCKNKPATDQEQQSTTSSSTISKSTTDQDEDIDIITSNVSDSDASNESDIGGGMIPNSILLDKKDSNMMDIEDRYSASTRSQPMHINSVPQTD